MTLLRNHSLIADHHREFGALSTGSETPLERKAELGQFMTPVAIARFMANLFADLGDRNLKLLDAGAGAGMLTAQFAERACRDHPRSLHCTAWEVDALLHPALSESLASCRDNFSDSGIPFACAIQGEDFIIAGSSGVRYGTTPKFTHAILNPPYRKLKADSNHRLALRKVGIETSNLYSAFVALALHMLEEGGELVAIIPRSFCNGPYFKPFRKLLLDGAALRHLHLFASRLGNFVEDAVLQENLIVHWVKGGEQTAVTLSASRDGSFTGLTERLVPFDQIVLPGDDTWVIHIPTDVDGEGHAARMARFPHTVETLGLSVSTGPVVDFRLKAHLRMERDEHCAPLIYSQHFAKGLIVHPQATRKPNGIVVNPETDKWLFPRGYYVCVRRLSSKEERRRIVPALYDPEQIAAERIGFENHLNVFHQGKQGLPPDLARGLALYLGSSFVDDWLRQFSGHTQVNAGDLRRLGYPDRSTLENWGKTVADRADWPEQAEIDHWVDHGG